MFSCALGKAFCLPQAIPITTLRNTHPLQCFVRGKHSSRQIKRIFNKHPARARFERRNGITHQDEQLPTHSPQLPQIFTPQLLSNGWSAPPPPEIAAKTLEYPFRVSRTKDKPMNAVGFLPVYTKYRNDGTKIVTRIRKVAGDQNAFLKELTATLQLSPNQVRVRTGGTVEVTGNRVREIKQWLAGLGF